MLQQPPEPLNSLLTAVHFNQAARTYNSVCQLASTGSQYDAAVSCVRMHGRAYHRTGTILPPPGQPVRSHSCTC
jgi:hypothetical protein